MKNQHIPLQLATLAIVFSVSLAMPSNAQSLSNLFTSAEQRSHLDQLRIDYLARTEAEDFEISAALAAEADQEVDNVEQVVSDFHLAAIMSPNNKERSIWLNNTSYYESELPSNMNLINLESGLALLIKANNDEFILKPGQKVNTETGFIGESSTDTEAKESSNNVDDIKETELVSPLLSNSEGAVSSEDDTLPAPTLLADAELIPGPENSILENLDPSKINDPAVIDALRILQEAMND